MRIDSMSLIFFFFFFFFFQAEDGIRDVAVTGVQTCALPILRAAGAAVRRGCAPVVGDAPSPVRPASGGHGDRGGACYVAVVNPAYGSSRPTIRPFSTSVPDPGGFCTATPCSTRP